MHALVQRLHPQFYADLIRCRIREGGTGADQERAWTWGKWREVQSTRQGRICVRRVTDNYRVRHLGEVLLKMFKSADPRAGAGKSGITLRSLKVCEIWDRVAKRLIAIEQPALVDDRHYLLRQLGEGALEVRAVTGVIEAPENLPRE